MKAIARLALAAAVAAPNGAAALSAPAASPSSSAAAGRHANDATNGSGELAAAEPHRALPPFLRGSDRLASGSHDLASAASVLAAVSGTKAGQPKDESAGKPKEEAGMAEEAAEGASEVGEAAYSWLFKSNFWLKVGFSMLILLVVCVVAYGVWRSRRQSAPEAPEEIARRRVLRQQSFMQQRQSAAANAHLARATPASAEDRKELRQRVKMAAVKFLEGIQDKVEPGSSTRRMVDNRMINLSEKAKDFAMSQLNDLATEVMHTYDLDESQLVLEFNEAVEASFPPMSVLLAGITSPAIMATAGTWHVIQFAGLFLPVLCLTTWAVTQDMGVHCDIPTLRTWVRTALIISAVEVCGHALQAYRIYEGQAALKRKTKIMQKRLNHISDDHNIGNIADMRGIVISATVLIQESLILEDQVSRSSLVDWLGLADGLWVMAVLWNFFIVIVWTFVPGTTAFHLSVHEAAKGHFCGAWASVFTARMVCLLTPFFFFLNVAAVLKWMFVKIIHDDEVSRDIIEKAEELDMRNGGMPVVETLVKAFVLRGSPDALSARLTIALGEQINLMKERDDCKLKLKQVDNRIHEAKHTRKELRKVAEKSGDCLQANLKKLEKSSKKHHAEWKVKGNELIDRAQSRVEQYSDFSTTEELDRLLAAATEVAEKLNNSDVVKSALAKAQEASGTLRASKEMMGAMVASFSGGGRYSSQDAEEEEVEDKSPEPQKEKAEDKAPKPQKEEGGAKASKKDQGKGKKK